MASEPTITWLPKRGRGLVTAYSSHNLLELSDSFAEMRNVVIENGAWVTRPGDRLIAIYPNEILKTLHLFNQMGTDGSITTKLVWMDDLGVIKYDAGTLIAFASSPYEVFFQTVKNRLFFAGVGNDPRVWDGTTVASWGADGPTGTLGYSNFTADSADSKVETGTFTAAGTAITRTAGTVWSPNFADPAWVGKTFIGVDGIEHDITTVTGASGLTLQDAYAGANGAYIVRYGDRSWTEPPKYAYAYYNPTTGHITNISAVLTLSEREINNVAVFLTGIQTSSTHFDYGYTKIVLFRTLKDGGVLYPLKCDPTGTGSATIDADGYIENSGGPLTYQDNDGQDYNVGAILGLKEGQIDNFKAPDMRIFGYWDGRFFAVTEEFPWRTRYSKDVRDQELGVPEESWPEEYFRDLDGDSDQYATGMGVVGSSLLTSSLKAAYYMYGTDHGTYDFKRLSTRGFGVNQYALAEHPGDGSVASASAIYVSRDRRMWRHREGGTITDIGSVIQDKLDNGATMDQARPYFVKILRIRKMWLAFLGISLGSTQMQMYAYDFDQECWYDFGLSRVNSMDGSVVAGFGEPVVYFGTDDGTHSKVYSLMETGTSYFDNTSNGWMRTQHIDAGDRTVKKELAEFILYVNARSGNFGPVTVQFDEDGVDRDLTRVDIEDSPRDSGPGTIRYVYQAVRQWHSAQFKWYIPAVGYKIFKVEAILKPASTGVAGRPS